MRSLFGRQTSVRCWQVASLRLLWRGRSCKGSWSFYYSSEIPWWRVSEVGDSCQPTTVCGTVATEDEEKESKRKKTLQQWRKRANAHQKRAPELPCAVDSSLRWHRFLRKDPTTQPCYLCWSTPKLPEPNEGFEYPDVISLCGWLPIHLPQSIFPFWHVWPESSFPIWFSGQGIRNFDSEEAPLAFVSMIPIAPLSLVRRPFQKD